MRNFLLLIGHLLVLTVIDLEQLLQLQLQEGVLVHVRLSDTDAAVATVDLQVSLVELRQSAAVDLTLVWLLGLWILTWDREARRVLSLYVELMDTLAPADALLEQLLYHILELLVVLHQLAQLARVD